MTIRIELTAAQREELEHAFKHTGDRRLRERCQALLMVSRQRSRHAIAEDLGVHPESVRRWVKAYQSQGLAGLKIHWFQGVLPASLRSY